MDIAASGSGGEKSAHAEWPAQPTPTQHPTDQNAPPPLLLPYVLIKNKNAPAKFHSSIDVRSIDVRSMDHSLYKKKTTFDPRHSMFPTFDPHNPRPFPPTHTLQKIPWGSNGSK